MSSAAEQVFCTVELLDQILYGLDIEDLLTFQRINKTFRQNIPETRHLRRRASYGVNHVRGVINCECIFGLAWPTYREAYDRFLYLEPFKLSDGMCLRASGGVPKIYLEYDYYPRNTGSTANIGVWRGDKFYEKTQSWTNIWLPYTQTKVLESDETNIHSIAECLEDLAKESEKAWASMATREEDEGVEEVS